MTRMNIQKRRKRFRERTKYTTDRPRLSVHKTNQYTYAQLIDVRTGKVLVSYDTKRLVKDDPKLVKLPGVKKALEMGKILGKKIKKQKIEEILFDRSGYRYHGKVKAIAEGLREAGLKF